MFNWIAAQYEINAVALVMPELLVVGLLVLVIAAILEE